MSELPHSARGAYPSGPARMSRLHVARRTRQPLARRAGANLAGRGASAAGRSDVGLRYRPETPMPECGAAA
jgi:hypothetical protein